MPEQPARENSNSARKLFSLATLRQETLLFMLVSAMDVFMTYMLLSQDGGQQFTESNPVARFFIYGWGVKGMLYFKSAMVLFVCVLSQIIARHRPRTARWLLIGATAVVALVVAYSLRLLVVHGEISDIELSLTSWMSVRSAA